MKNTYPAPILKRLVALLIDYCVIVLYAVCLFGLAIAFYTHMFGGPPDLNVIGRAKSQALGFVTLTVPIGVYLFLTESGKRHATFGKRAMKLVVASVKAKNVTKKQILIRTIVKLLPWEIAHTFVWQVTYYTQQGGTPPLWVMAGLTVSNVLPVVYVAIVLFRKDHCGPHDLTAGTIVAVKK
jgi:uncharacterized RDD family membrane protein YckC